MLDHAGVPRSSVKQVDVGSNLVPAMISGRVDATLGGYWNYEAIELRQAHKKPNVIPVSAGGVPSYDELVLVTTEKYFENHVTLLRGLVQALGRGYAAVRANPQQGINALLAANPSLDPTLQAAAVHATLPAFFPGEDKPWGWQFSDQLERLRQVDVRPPPDQAPGRARLRLNQPAAGRSGAVAGSESLEARAHNRRRNRREAVRRAGTRSPRFRRTTTPARIRSGDAASGSDQS